MLEKELLRTVMSSVASLPTNEQQKVLSLTLREMQVLALLAHHLSYREIAEELCISPHTARSHSRNVMRKLGVSSKLDVQLWAQNAKLTGKRTFPRRPVAVSEQLVCMAGGRLNAEA